ncbi:MAG: phosphatidylglycerol lysyltransferase domain-containing protein [Bacteroidota bacterium]|nr:phosphatidylglycerol lysyltransferase domain-containing protein [Bacteroidota bacterium]
MSKKHLNFPPLYKKIRSFSPKLYWREILAALMIMLAFIFFRSERKELEQIIPNIENANGNWLIAGLCVTLLYILLQSGMYVSSFASIGLSLKWIDAIELFLKRNFLSIFLPAGGVSALAYTPSQLRKRGFNKTQIHQASGLYAFAGLLTVFLVGFPVVILFAISTNRHLKSAWIGLILVVFILAGIIWIARSLREKGKLYSYLEKKIPSAAPLIDELFAANVNNKKYTGAVLFSTGVELSGMFHLFIAMLALGLPASFSVAAIAYMVSVLLMITSPFLRGLGAVEISIVYILEMYGYSTVQALSITVLYRVFEFWLPMAFGILAFAWRGRQLFIRIVPALLIFAQGLINIISVVTPPLRIRLKLIREFVPLEAINASNVLVLFIGVALIITSAFMFKGLKNAWRLALLLSVLSLIGNLTKAFDYEEATFAGVIAILLLLSRNQYRIRGSVKWIRLGILSIAIVFLSVLIFGYVSFYFIDVKHFGIDFTWRQSLLYTMQIFLLGGENSLHPLTPFGHQFIILIRVLGFLSWGFLLFTIIKPFIKIEIETETGRERAKFLLNQYGNSTVDYFKTYRDKLFFFSELHDAFVSYRIANGFAIVLEEPVCAEEHKMEVLEEFYKQCKKMGLRTAFYRVDENSILWFNKLRKQKMIIGQEAILDVEHFKLEGKDKKSLRNGLNGLQKKGYTTAIHKAPLTNDLVADLRKISDEWLEAFDKEEQIFSQGMFDPKEIIKQDVIAIADNEGKIAAFLNIIPDYSPDECTYDLIRKTVAAPGGCMDALIIKLIEYAKEHKCQYINLGLVPMTGITEPQSPAEQIIKYAGEKLKRFKHYHGLRDFKEKYATLWEDKFLVYESDYDLLQLPAALNKVMQP